jgi:hypothetical protein
MSTALEFALEECVELLTEGGNDAGVDGVHIGDVDADGFIVTLFQGKYKIRDLSGTANFPETGVQSAVQTVEMLFDPQRRVALNERLEPHIAEACSLIVDGYIPTIRIVLCNNGARWTSQADAWARQAKRDYRDQLELIHFNHDAIVRSLQRGPHVDAVMMLSGGIVTEDPNFRRVLIGRVSVHELHRLFDEHGDRLLEHNIRRYLGHANRVNMDIRATLLDDAKSPNFYFYNNGITVICDRFDFNALQRTDYVVRMKNVQVINGGQTCKTIHRTLTDNNSCATEAHLLIRIYQLPGESREVVQEITKATNSQSPVDLRDLRSNDERQKTLALGMEQLGYGYKRHRDERGFTGEVITSTLVAESVLAVWRAKPHQARFHRHQHFAKLYDLIFADLAAPQALLAAQIYRFVKRARKLATDDSPDFLPYASYHLAMLIGRDLLASLQITPSDISHRNFGALQSALESDGERHYAAAVDSLKDALRRCYGDREVSLQQLAATFRRGDLLEMLNAPNRAVLRGTRPAAHLTDRRVEQSGPVRPSQAADVIRREAAVDVAILDRQGRVGPRRGFQAQVPNP